MSSIIPILSIDNEASIMHPENLMVYVGYINLRNVYQEDNDYFVDTILGKIKLSDEAKNQYLNYQHALAACDDSIECTFSYFMQNVKKYGWRVETRFTGREILYFDMTVTL